MLNPFHNLWSIPGNAASACRWRAWPRRWPLVLTAVLTLVTLPLRAAETASAPTQLRFGFTARVFDGVNINDARAAIKVWTQQIAREHHLPVSPDVVVIPGQSELDQALQQREVEAIALTIDEFWHVRDKAPVGRIVLALNNGLIGDEYVLIIRRETGMRSLADLKGKSLNVHRSPRSTVIEPWLNHELTSASLPRLDTHFDTVKRVEKMSAAVLPVFFAQVDACLVHRAGFDLLVELNPQLGQKLVAIRTSDPIVSSLFFFRADTDSDLIDRVMEVFINSGSDPAANQITMLFQQQELATATWEDLEPAFELLRQNERLDDAPAAPTELPPPAASP